MYMRQNNQMCQFLPQTAQASFPSPKHLILLKMTSIQLFFLISIIKIFVFIFPELSEISFLRVSQNFVTRLHIRLGIKIFKKCNYISTMKKTKITAPDYYPVKYMHLNLKLFLLIHICVILQHLMFATWQLTFYVQLFVSSKFKTP